MALTARQFKVNFYHKAPGAGGKGARGTIQGTVGQALGGSASETAVLKYLQNKYNGQEITINKLDWLG